MAVLLSDGDNYKLTECPDCIDGQRTYAVRSYGGRLTGEEETRDCETCAGEGFVEVEEVESAETNAQRAA